MNDEKVIPANIAKEVALRYLSDNEQIDNFLSDVGVKVAAAAINGNFNTQVETKNIKNKSLIESIIVPYLQNLGYKIMLSSKSLMIEWR